MAESLSIYELIVDASLLVQIVMGILVLASLISWVMIFQRWFALSGQQRAMDAFEDEFWSGVDLRKLYTEVNSDGGRLRGYEHVFVAGFKEFSRLNDQAGADPDATLQGAQRAMRVALNREEEELERHIPFLATVGSTSPYIGLFGTVWGIMNSFRSLANMSQATLATVAPGISEALVATAMGLAAAIPAVIAYNRFSARVEVLAKRLETFSDELMGILARAAHSNQRRSA
ncbi:MAG: protein TolQ [Pseudomonadota bacterium]